jgi:galactitol-specific phosphotransferase system IIB component
MHPRRKSMSESFMKVDEVVRELGVSKPYAYKLVQKLNDELKKKNLITISGRVSRRYFEERVYGSKKSRGGE